MGKHVRSLLPSLPKNLQRSNCNANDKGKLSRKNWSSHKQCLDGRSLHSKSFQKTNVVKKNFLVVSQKIIHYKCVFLPGGSAKTVNIIKESNAYLWSDPGGVTNLGVWGTALGSLGDTRINDEIRDSLSRKRKAKSMYLKREGLRLSATA